MKKEKQDKKVKEKKKFRSSIGGQAVIEGVMMRGERSMATCVREENGNIAVETERVKSVKEKPVWYRIPFVRGVFNFFISMVSGVKILMRSAEVYAGEEETSKAEEWMAKKLKINVMSLVMAFAVVLGLALSIGLFFFLPLVITDALKALDTGNVLNHSIYWNLIDGVLRLIIFVMYIFLASRLKDVKRTFMYHGAEHKTISCYEHGLELTVENAQKMSTVHDRCGTTFMFLVMVISILVFSLTGWSEISGLGKVANFFIRFLIRLALLPVVAGVSYEILKFLAKFDNPFVKVIKAPGLLLQKLTTKQPTDEMVEVAIAAFECVREMDADESIPERKFDVKLLYKKARGQVAEILKDVDGAETDIDWLFVEELGVKRSELDGVSHIKQSQLDSILAKARLRATHMPLQQVLGYTDFYGYRIKVTADVLCPRPETEYLCEECIKLVKEKSYKRALDLCTGSGAIAVAIADSVESVVAADISQEALLIAEANAETNGKSNISFVQSDLFESVDGTFDMIVSNPPYIKSGDIGGLQPEVRDHEPRNALDGGEDGYDFYRKIIPAAPARLNEGGALAFECGDGQCGTVAEMMSGEFVSVNIVKDLEGKDRIVTGVKK